MRISIIVAFDQNKAIGKQNQLLCHLPADLAFFKKTTGGHHIFMGRKTFESIGRPLPNRVNQVLSTSMKSMDGIEIYHHWEAASAQAAQNSETEWFVVGGAQVYADLISHTDRIYATRIEHAFEGADAYFPAFESDFELISQIHYPADEKNQYAMNFQVYERKK